MKMRYKQVQPRRVSSRYRQYNHSSLVNAFMAVKDDKMPVARAARVFNVPMQTLRDRVLGKVEPDTVTTGRAPLFTLDEEAKLVNHLTEVAKLGYGYTRQEVVDIASDYAIQLGRRKKASPLTVNWFVKFAKRWPELRVLKPHALEIQRAKCASTEVVDGYFSELTEIIETYNLQDKPELIFNVDEKGISQNHTPPYVVAGNSFRPQAVTSGKSKTTTIIGCGSAAGLTIPPFFVFAGAKMMPDLMKGASPGAFGTVSKTGWSNSAVFRQYIQDHFLKFVPQRDADQHLLLLLDGHKSHVAVNLVEFAKRKNIILFVLPAHTSHILQPMDVGCYGPFQKMYHFACHKFMRETSATITRYNVCSLACKVYTKALSSENLFTAFKKTGIHPLDKSAINEDCLKPAEVFGPSSPAPIDTISEATMDIVNETSEIDMAPESAEMDTSSESDLQVVPSPEKNKPASSPFTSRLDALRTVKREGTKKPRQHIGRIVSGKAITESSLVDKLIAHQTEQASKSKSKRPAPFTGKKTKKSAAITAHQAQKSSKARPAEPALGPSHICVSDTDDITTDDEEIPDEEKCCVCGKFTPNEVRNSPYLKFTKWVKCDGLDCNHWVHLRYCTAVTVVRRGDKYYCPHCPEDPVEE